MQDVLALSQRRLCNVTHASAWWVLGQIQHVTASNQMLIWRNCFPLESPLNWFDEEMRVWASYQIRKIAGCTCTGNARNVSPRGQLQRKPLVSDPGMHHGTCVTHVPWCMSGSLTRGGGEKRSRHSRRMHTRNFTYLAGGPWVDTQIRARTCP